ncbi:MAG: PIG-L family deacetylase [Planctomycetota bacterium JB042]
MIARAARAVLWPGLLLVGAGTAPLGCATPAGDRIALNDGPFPGPRVLAVVAHPDDEIAFGGLLYKTATHLGGACDVLTITNGEGGYKYSTLAEPLYGLALTDEAVGRRHLPAIRRRELSEGCRLLGVRRLILLEETDHRYTLDVDELLGDGAAVWDVPRVARILDEVLAEEGYDFVVTHAPVAETHGHHKAATVLALEAVARLPVERRPVVLCVRGSSAERPLEEPYVELPGHPVTRVAPDAAPFVFDRTQKFGYRDRLDYRIVTNWAIAAHRSQGTMQLLMNRGERENYFPFAMNGDDAAGRAKTFFDRLAEPQFETPESPEPAPAP